MPTVDFCTFCYEGDKHRLYALGQFRRQVMSNCYKFNKLIVVHQKCQPPHLLEDLGMPLISPMIVGDNHVNKILSSYNIDLTKKQYESSTDKHHTWKVHCVNHLYGASVSDADYILFADNDCWMLNPINWIDKAIHTIEHYPDCFIVSPNDGENSRQTQRISQQMFLCKREDFIQANFNQPGYSGNPKDYDVMPEYHAMLEGRIHYHCVNNNKYRYVLPLPYRYWHFNRTNNEDYFELDYTKY